MIEVLVEREFPIGELRLLASERSAGRRLAVGGLEQEVGLATPDAFDGIDIALFSAGAGTSKTLAPEAAARTAPWSSTTRPPGGWSPASRSSSAR